MTELSAKNVAVVGFGVEGASAALFLKKKGARVTICDQNEQLDVPAGYETHLGAGYLANLDEFDLIVRSPGTKPELLKTTTSITSPTQLFLERCLSPIIGVTGTKGKGTTSTLIAHMLEAAGLKAHLGGNIGTPMLDLLPQIRAEDYVVLELSSFQLYDVTISPHIAVVLMIEPDHLDWHSDVADYVAGKAQIARFQTEQDVVVYHAHNAHAKQIAEQSKGRKLAYLSDEGAHLTDEAIVIDGKTICHIPEVGLIGPHNLENICAALTAVWQVTQDVPALKRAIIEFKGLEHRLEFVRELEGVKYYNDSFSVAPMATVAALRSFAEPKVIILGGSDKGVDYHALIKELGQSKIRQIILIGNTTHPRFKATAPKIETALRSYGVVAITSLAKPGGSGMGQIVEAARHAAQAGDVVLLSPACASFDMFTDYTDRGHQFKAAVMALQER